MTEETFEEGAPEARSLESLLDEHRAHLARFLERHGSGLLRFESVSDLVQGVQLHALKVADRFEYQGEKEFRGWLAKVGRQHIADRHAYWSARKRDAGKMLRITQGAGSTSSPGVHPAAGGTGPSTFASRREQLTLAMKAISLLLPRDQQLVKWMSEDVPIAEMAKRLDISYDAAERARLRAIERYKKTFELLSR